MTFEMNFHDLVNDILNSLLIDFNFFFSTHKSLFPYYMSNVTSILQNSWQLEILSKLLLFELDSKAALTRSMIWNGQKFVSIAEETQQVKGESKKVSWLNGLQLWKEQEFKLVQYDPLYFSFWGGWGHTSSTFWILNSCSFQKPAHFFWLTLNLNSFFFNNVSRHYNIKIMHFEDF